MVSGGMTCVKCMLFCFNLLFVISGIAILSVGAIIQAAYYHYGEFVDANVFTPPMILIVVGVTVLFIAFFGCCGAVRENHCMISTFAVFLLVLFVLELTAGVIGYVRKDAVEKELEFRMNATMPEYLTSEKIQRSWDVVQHDFKCCGTNSPADWNRVYHNDTLPYTCCNNLTRDNKDQCTVDSETAVTDGCLPHLKEVLKTNGHIIAGVAIGVGSIQLVGLVFACCLARSIRREYETV